MNNTFSRALNRLYTIAVTRLMERREPSVQAGIRTDLKYLLFEKKGSDALIIVFQACHDQEARYNYVRTLKDFPASRLYIKDDFAENGLGNYYIGEHGTGSTEMATRELIAKIIRKTQAKRVFFVGSSKGGYGAINFGIEHPGAVMIVAAPQYFLGSYLAHGVHRPNLANIVGEPVTQDKIDALNLRLRDKLLTNRHASTQKVYIHYSTKEHTYGEHVEALLADMRASGLTLTEDALEYTAHDHLRFFYPAFLVSTLEKELIK